MLGGGVDFWKTLGVLVRRWYVALPAAVVSLGLAFAVFQSVPPKYESTGSVVLLAPSGGSGASSDRGPNNPLLSFDGSLTTASTAITQVLLSPEVADELYKQGATAGFEVGDGQLGGPFINVVATGSSPDEARRTVELVLQRARDELREREVTYRAPPGTFIQVDNLVEPTAAKRLVGGKLRAGGAALALGLAASLSAAFVIESIGENRRRRGQHRAELTRADLGRTDLGRTDLARANGTHVPDDLSVRMARRSRERAGG